MALGLLLDNKLSCKWLNELFVTNISRVGHIVVLVGFTMLGQIKRILIKSKLGHFKSFI